MNHLKYSLFGEAIHFIQPMILICSGHYEGIRLHIGFCLPKQGLPKLRQVEADVVSGWRWLDGGKTHGGHAEAFPGSDFMEFPVMSITLVYWRIACCCIVVYS